MGCSKINYCVCTAIEGTLGVRKDNVMEDTGMVAVDWSLPNCLSSPATMPPDCHRLTHE